MKLVHNHSKESSFLVDLIGEYPLNPFLIVRSPLFDERLKKYIPHLLLRDMGTHWERITYFHSVYTYEKPTMPVNPGTLQTIRFG